MTNDELIATLAAATIINDDRDLTDFRALDAHDQTLLIIDYRDEFASSPFDMLADAKIDERMINLILDRLHSITA